MLRQEWQRDYGFCQARTARYGSAQAEDAGVPPEKGAIFHREQQEFGI